MIAILSHPARRFLLLFFFLGIPFTTADAADLGFRTGDLVFLDCHQLTIEVARTKAERIRGLAGRKALGPDRGMLFVYPNPKPRSFWMKGMRMSIDLIWIAGQEVIGVAVKLTPPRPGDKVITVTSPGPVDLVLEVEAGWVRAKGIRPGARLTLEPAGCGD